MKNFLIICFCLTFHSILAQNDDVKKVIIDFFEAFHARDTIALQQVCRKEIVLHSVAVKKSENVFSVESASEFYKSIASIPADSKFKEQILSYSIHSDGAIAHVWTPYEFYINEKLSHAGVNSFQLVREKGIWKISYCIDTRKPK